MNQYMTLCQNADIPDAQNAIGCDVALVLQDQDFWKPATTTLVKTSLRATSYFQRTSADMLHLRRRAEGVELTIQNGVNAFWGARLDVAL